MLPQWYSKSCGSPAMEAVQPYQSAPSTVHSLARGVSIQLIAAGLARLETLENKEKKPGCSPHILMLG